MIRTKSKENYAKMIDVYNYYIDRSQLNPTKASTWYLLDNSDALEVFDGSYHALRRGIIKLFSGVKVGKKNFERQKALLDIYKHKQ
jgi:hypothetical protein